MNIISILWKEKTFAYKGNELQDLKEDFRLIIFSINVVLFDQSLNILNKIE